MYSILRYGMLLLFPFLLASQHLPKGRFKSNPHFTCDTFRYEVEKQVYNFVTFRGKPFKRHPFNWTYHNPAESLSSGKQMLKYARDASLVNDSQTEQWVYIFPFYELSKPVSGIEYHQFIRYARDSVLHYELGTHMGATYYTRNGDLRIRWTSSSEVMAYRDYFADYYYNVKSLGTPKFDPQYFVYEKRLAFIRSEFCWPKMKYFETPDSITQRRSFIHHDDRIRVYPDTFLWMQDSSLAVDSTVAFALANGYWSVARHSENLPAFVAHGQSRAYVNWVAEHWIENRTIASGLQAHGKCIPIQNKYRFKADPSDLAHCKITNKEYQEFLLYCKDSIIRAELGDPFKMLLYNNNGNPRLNWMRPLKGLKVTDVRKALGRLCETVENEAYLSSKAVVFRYNTVRQKQMEEDYQKAGSASTFLAQRSIEQYQKRHETIAYPVGSAYKQLLLLGQLKPLKSLNNDAPVKGINYEQACAFWHWRLREKLKKSAKSIGDFYIPTQAEWRLIQSGTPITSKDVELPTSFRSFKYRIYVSTS